MSQAKERNYQNTKKRLLDALKRLQNNAPTVAALKDKAQAGKLKINRLSVETEADLSVGVLRNHDDVVKLINDSNQKPHAGTTNASMSDAHKQQTKALQEKLKTAKEKNIEQQDETKRMSAAMLAQLQQFHMITQAMFEEIPLEDRKLVIDKMKNNRTDNVVNINKAKTDS